MQRNKINTLANPVNYLKDIITSIFNMEYVENDIIMADILFEAILIVIE